MGVADRDFSADLRTNKRFLLQTGDLTVLSRIRKVTADTVHVTVPFADYPITGMAVAMDFHDPAGCTRYETFVVQSPLLGSSEAVLAYPISSERVYHRTFTRVTVSLQVKFREMDKVKFRDGIAKNISAGGILLETDYRMTQGTAIEFEIALTKAESMTVLGKIVHVVRPARGAGKGASRLYGCEFTEIEQPHRKAIIEYVWDVLEKTQRAATSG
jgi:hypothetical protein